MDNYVKMDACFCPRTIWFQLAVVAVLLYFVYQMIVFLRRRCFPQSPSAIRRRKKAAAKKNKAQAQSNSAVGSMAKMGYKVSLVGSRRKFKFHSLVDATQNFRVDRRMSSSDLGVFYKGEIFGSIRTKEEFAILRLNPCTRQTSKDFVDDVWLLSRANHPNLAKLIGYSDDEGMSRCLVYEYVPGGSLETYLLGNQKCLDWKTRMKIALDVACSIYYLQNIMKPSIHHYFINPSNIWLDKNFTPKLSAFGVTMMYRHFIMVQPYSYAWPDYRLNNNNNITIQADIYGFGILLLQLITAKEDVFREDGVVKKLTNWVQPYLKDKSNLSKMVDPMLEGKVDIEEVYECCSIAERCMEKQPDSRPLIADVMSDLNHLIMRDYDFSLKK